MDITFRRLLDAVDDPHGGTVAMDPLAVVDAFGEELPGLSRLSKDEFAAKLADIRDDVAVLGEHARRAAERHRQAQRIASALDELARFTGQRVDETDDLRDRSVERSSARNRSRSQQSDTTRERVRRVVTENPPQHWTPQLVHDELRRIGWPATRSAVQTALQRLAENGNDVRRVRPGTYEAADRTPISKGSANGSGDSQRAFESAMDRPPANANEEWLTAEILQRVADEAAACFLTAHPGESDPGTLVGEATRRVNGWIERHNQEPYDEGHVRRLMKTALSDHYQRTRRNGSRLHHDALQKGGDR